MKFIFASFLLFLCVCNLYSGENIPNLADLNLEEKIGQMLMVHFKGEVANDDAKLLINDAHVGGFIFYNWSNGLDSPTQVQNLSNSLQKIAQQQKHSIPLLLAVDQEGGKVARLRNGFTEFAGNFALANTGRLDLAAACGLAMGKEMKAVGLNMNLAPVVDVNTNPLNPVIGIRAFSNSPEVVTSYASAMLDGFHNAGLITCLKHFPGHGDVEVDSHSSMPVVNKSKDVLDHVELYPFAKLCNNVDCIMTAHILVPALDPDNCATLSKRILKDLLRDELGFKGIVVSDSIIMQGLTDNVKSIEEAAIKSIKAGCDILILGGKLLQKAHVEKELTPQDVLRIHRAILIAVQNGTISSQDINISVTRILKLKKTHNLYAFRYPNSEDIVQFINTIENKQLASQIVELSLQTQK